MRKLNALIIFGLLIGTSACSSKKSKEEPKEAPSEAVVEQNTEEFNIDDIAESTPQQPEVVQETPSLSGGPIEAYTVEQGDTLMLISFKIYGDYRRWRELANQNAGVDLKKLKAGTVLNYVAPEKKFVWNPEGLPHLIRKNETLGSISSDKYGTTKKWKDIWNNNKPMIIDPNLIFEGFTLYYKPMEEVVSKVTK